MDAFLYLFIIFLSPFAQSIDCESHALFSIIIALSSQVEKRPSKIRGGTDNQFYCDQVSRKVTLIVQAFPMLSPQYLLLLEAKVLMLLGEVLVKI